MHIGMNRIIDFREKLASHCVIMISTLVIVHFICRVVVSAHPKYHTEKCQTQISLLEGCHSVPVVSISTDFPDDFLVICVLSSFDGSVWHSIPVYCVPSPTEDMAEYRYFLSFPFFMYLYLAFSHPSQAMPPLTLLRLNSMCN